MTSEEEELIQRREEIKEKSVEYSQAKRIVENFDQVNDLVVNPIMESRQTMLSTIVRKNKYTIDFVQAFNQVKRDARSIYMKNMEWFLSKLLNDDESTIDCKCSRCKNARMIKEYSQ